MNAAEKIETEETTINEFIELMDEKKLVVPDMLIPIEKVMQLVNRKKASIYKLIKKGKFPKQHPHIKGMWSLRTITHYISTGEIL